MDQTWTDYIKHAMKETGITQKELADQLGVSTYQLRTVIIEQERVTLEQLAKLRTILHLNLSEVLDEDAEGHHDLLLDDEMQVCLNQIARSIPQRNKIRFLKAVRYLSQCFDEKE